MYIHRWTSEGLLWKPELSDRAAQKFQLGLFWQKVPMPKESRNPVLIALIQSLSSEFVDSRAQGRVRVRVQVLFRVPNPSLNPEESVGLTRGGTVG